jgi:hypothetical protein
LAEQAGVNTRTGALKSFQLSPGLLDNACFPLR